MDEALWTKCMQCHLYLKMMKRKIDFLSVGNQEKEILDYDETFKAEILIQ
jgi:hypothetical protein